MKNLLSSAMSTLETTSRMTARQRAILIGFTILPGALPILIFSLFVRQIIRRQEKEKILKIFGNYKKNERTNFNRNEK